MELTVARELCTLAVNLARQAGRLARQRFGQVCVSRKEDASIVTDVDFELQEFIVEQITRRHPKHDIIAEEQRPGARPASQPGGCCWIIDPLDGSRNYAHGVPCCGIAIGVLFEGDPVAGAIYDPFADRMYHGVKSGGAFLNESRLQRPVAPRGRDYLIGIPTAHHRPLPDAIYGDWARRYVLRNLGTTALHLGLLSCGAFSACFGQETKLWDIAAGAVLVTEVGCRLTSPIGRPVFPVDASAYSGENIEFLAAQPELHDRLVESLSIT